MLFWIRVEICKRIKPLADYETDFGKISELPLNLNYHSSDFNQNVHLLG